MEKIKSAFSANFFVSIFLISIFPLIPLLLIPIVNYGQLGKQTFAAEMIRSLLNGEIVHGFFPIRHFLESHHSGLVPWAEEFPLYDWIVGAFAVVFHATPVFAAKAVSFLGWLALIFGFFKIGRYFSKDAATPWIFASVAAIFPAFRLYSIEVMPDLCMTACCVFAVERALRERPKTSAVWIGLASLFKYYAVFTGFGIGLFYLYRAFREKKYRPLVNGLWLGLAILPCILYIVYFIHLQIPNPITEYRASDGHGHLSSLHGLLEPKKWGRVFLWVFVKNSTLFGTFLAAIGLYRNRKTLPPILIALIAGWLCFPLFFIESFYVHDYYGLQASIGVAIFAALGLDSLRKNPRILAAALGIFLIWSIVHVRGMSRPIRDFDWIQARYPEIVQRLGSTPQWGFVFSGVSKPVIPYLLNLNAWMADFTEVSKPETLARLRDPRIDVVFVHQFRSLDAQTEPVTHAIESTGLYHEIENDVLDETRFIVYRRNAATKTTSSAESPNE